MNLLLNDQLGEVSITRATALYMEVVRKCRTPARWKVIARGPEGASPLNLEEQGTFKVFMDTRILMMFVKATNDTEECIHLEYMENPPSPTDIGVSYSEELRNFSSTLQSDERFYLSVME